MSIRDLTAGRCDQPPFSAVEHAVHSLDRHLYSLEIAEVRDEGFPTSTSRLAFRGDLMRLVTLDLTSDKEEAVRLDALERIRAVVGDEHEDFLAASVLLIQRNRRLLGHEKASALALSS